MKNFYTTALQLINEDVHAAYRKLVNTQELHIHFLSETRVRLKIALQNGAVYTTKLSNDIDTRVMTEMLFADFFNETLKDGSWGI